MKTLLAEFETETKGFTLPLEQLISSIAWDARGLVPAITQAHDTNEVLMMAWVNETALRATLATGFAHYWSRSRGQLWKKGETSGNTQQLMALYADCDGDALLMKVAQIGPACHTGRKGCFFWQVDGEGAHMISSMPAFMSASMSASAATNA